MILRRPRAAGPGPPAEDVRDDALAEVMLLLQRLAQQVWGSVPESV